MLSVIYFYYLTVLMLICVLKRFILVILELEKIKYKILFFITERKFIPMFDTCDKHLKTPLHTQIKKMT